MRTIDVSGLPEPVIQDIENLVTTLRHSCGRNGDEQPEKKETAEEWIARFRAWAESHPKREITFDDSRESIYEGRGE